MDCFVNDAATLLAKAHCKVPILCGFYFAFFDFKTIR